MTKAQEHMLQLIEQLERDGKQPKLTKLPTKRNHKIQLRGRRSVL